LLALLAIFCTNEETMVGNSGGGGGAYAPRTGALSGFGVVAGTAPSVAIG